VADSRPSSAFVRAAGNAETMLAAHRAWSARRSTVGDTLRRVADELERIYGALFALRAERERLANAAGAAVDSVVADTARRLHAVARALHTHATAVDEDGAARADEGLPGAQGERVEALRPGCGR